MRTKAVPSTWLSENNCRLDCGPYMSGAIEAKVLLEKLPVKKDRLREVTLNGADGIVNAGRFKRLWVDDPKYGVRFLSSSDILEADLCSAPLIATKAVTESPKLLIRDGWTLITRSGSIGRMAFSRPEMDGVACSEHVMRVIPDRSKIPPGYLFAFLNSTFGIPLVIGGTYGAIIQHIEPEHLEHLPIPRIDIEREKEISDLIVSAANCRSESSQKRIIAFSEVESRLGWKKLWGKECDVFSVSINLSRRMDAFYYSGRSQVARQALANMPRSIPLKELVESIFEPGRGKRFKVESEEYGVPFFSSSSVFRTSPKAEYLISRNTPGFENLLIENGDVLIARSGSRGGVIGRAVLPMESMIGKAATEHLVRVRCKSRRIAQILFAILGSQPGYFALLGTSYGSAIPSLDCALIGELLVPDLSHGNWELVENAVQEMESSREKAEELESRAATLLEHYLRELIDG